ncbi:autophagy protein Apg17-domain-containing protein [Crassisporium funariophilum]|nr:autophagy protein Apg17-domain-containing protein [Crassisporium funariophilum]
MAALLESLAGHYGQMAGALRDTEAGEVFGAEDMLVMNRDTEELPVIMKELEENARAIESYHAQLVGSREESGRDLEHLGSVLDELDELGEVIGMMLATQEAVENKAEEFLNTLTHHLSTLSHLHERFVAYRMAFNKLVLEIARRGQYCEALDSMTEEENKVRTHFNAEYGLHLPEDLCLCIANAPTRWEVVPWQGAAMEVLPCIDADLIKDARERVGEGHGAESL